MSKHNTTALIAENKQRHSRRAARLQPIRFLTCCCCGGETRGRQWWNRDTGFGLCANCIPLCAKNETPEEFERCYGIRSVHFDLSPVCDPIPQLVKDLRANILPTFWVDYGQGCANIGYIDNRDPENVNGELRHLAGTLATCGFTVRVLQGEDCRARMLDVLPA